MSVPNENQKAPVKDVQLLLLCDCLLAFFFTMTSSLPKATNAIGAIMMLARMQSHR